MTDRGPRADHPAVPSGEPAGGGRLRVGLLLHALTGGGGEAVARSWAEQLVICGHEVCYLLYGADATPETGRPHETVVFGAGSTFSRWVRLPRWVRRTAVERRLDVVVSVLDFSNLTAVRALGRPGPRSVRVVLSEHTVPTVHWRHQGLGGRVKKQLARLLYRRADAVIAVSHAVAADLRAGYGVAADRLFVLPNPVPAAAEPSAAQLTRPGELRRIVSVGRLTRVKRVDRLFEVLRVLRSRGIDCSAVVIGDGPVRAELEQLARRLELPVHFTGWTAAWQEQVRPGDCLLVTADVEGFGNVLVEAAAAGVPAVAPSSALGVGDALVPGLTGVLARSPRAEDLADALCEAATLPLRPDAVQAWLHTFSPALAGRRVEAVLTRLCGQPASSRDAIASHEGRGDEPTAGGEGPRIVTHLGPEPHSQGGIASVLRSYQAMHSSRHEHRFIGTWAPDGALWSALPSARAAARLLRTDAEELGVVHVHLSFGGSFVREGALVALARARHLPVVATLHGSGFLRFRDTHPRLVDGVLKRTDRIIVLSDEVRRSLPAELSGRRDRARRLVRR